MQTYTTDAINIKSYSLSENDKIIVMFSKEMGLIKGIAKGVKRPKSSLGARMQAFVANKVVLNQRRNLDIIKEAGTLNTFNKLRSDFDKLTSAFYALETINTFCLEENKDKEQNETVYNILYDTLDLIQNSKTKTDQTLTLIKFQLNFMKIAGFGLEFERCIMCSKKPTDETVLFSPYQGGIICPDHSQIENVKYVKLHPKIREFLNALNHTGMREETKYDSLVNDKVTNGCFNLLKKYIEITGNRKSRTFEVMEASKVG